ncbi:PQQ-binding-like beta-propeller repeat protein [Actinoplanes sp. NPDC051851]|uniref:outer membrane protein assembly factor BamB family protein n=1 Tax=Actinoplanes sp. NPDC051851 TaxID=3154753 RepID=UPI0034366410
MGDVVIDLGLDRGTPESYAKPGRRTTSPWLPPFLVAVLVLLAAAASAGPARSPLDEVLRTPIGPADPYLITEGRVLVQSRGVLTAYDLAAGGLRWRTAQPVPVYQLRSADGLVLLRPWATGRAEPGTTAVSIATGTAEWHHRRNVITATGGDLMIAVSGVRSSSRTRVEGEVDALDPVTGLTRWQVRVPSTGVLLTVPGPADLGPRMMLVRDDRTASLYDTGTGDLLATRALPAAGYGPANPVVAGGVVLLRHPGPSGTEVSAYDAATLRPLWTEPAGDTVEVHTCGLLACLVERDGIVAVDPATGDERWRHDGWRSAEQHGMSLVVSVADAPVATVDPASGRVLVDLTGWHLIGGTDGSGRSLVTRAIDGGARTMVAVADPAVSRPRPIAVLPAGTGDCQAAPGRLVCRSTTGELIVWGYTEG